MRAKREKSYRGEKCELEYGERKKEGKKERKKEIDNLGEEEEEEDEDEVKYKKQK